MSRPFKYFLGQSFFLHLGIIVAFALATWALNISIEKNIRTNTILVESSVRIDMVAMPKLTIKELRNVAPVDLGGSKDSAVNEPPKAKSLNESKVEFKKEAEKPLSFAEKMKLLSKKEAKVDKRVAKEAASSKSKVKGKSQKALKDLVLAGNKLSKGTSITGVGAGGINTPFIQYLQTLPEHIRPNWKLPSYLMNQNLQCRIRIFLGQNGKLLKAEIFQSSGVEEYDNKAIEAVKNSSPFPKLTQELSAKGTSGDIILGFPL